MDRKSGMDIKTTDDLLIHAQFNPVKNKGKVVPVLNYLSIMP
jgi:hypothetical protein